MSQNDSTLRGFPLIRLRRLRRNKAIRDLLQEIRLSVKDFVYPIIIQQNDTSLEIPSMPGFRRVPLKNVSLEVDRYYEMGLRSFILFGLPSVKDNMGSNAHSKKGIIQKSLKLLRDNFSENIVLMTDVCLCQYTEHGHCGIIKDKVVNNDCSLHVLNKIAISHAEQGADFVAPSAMMDGQVKSIRLALDAAGYQQIGIMGYSAKMSSNLYTPFRDAAQSVPYFGDRKSYQMSYSNSNEAMQEIGLDTQEGSDILIIKPTIPYLDLLYKAKKETHIPICAYSVSGEYSMIKAAAIEGWINEDDLILEFTTSIKRAGADIIITYHAKRLAELLLGN
jgi:porphobilinogen synthase